MNRSRLVILPLLLCAIPVMAQQKQTSGLPLPLKEIIGRFAAAESENKALKNNYTYTQDYEVVTLGPGDTITGRFYRQSDIVYGDDGQPIEKIILFPPSTLTEIRVTYEDIQDLTGIQPFALTLSDVAKYQIDFVGKESLDQLTTYVFDVKPLQIRKGERYLQGRIWVEENDLQIVKVTGQAVPETNEQKFPHFETRRQRIDEHYWFPTFTFADDTLKFKRGNRVHVRMTIKYSNYKKFTTAIRIADSYESAPAKNHARVKPGQIYSLQPKVEAKPRSVGPPETAEARKTEAENAEVIRLAGEGKFKEALALAENLLMRLEKTLGADHADVALALRTVASLYYTQEEFSKAEPLYERALLIWENRLGADHPDLEQPLTNLTSVAMARKDYLKAETLLRRALLIKEKAVGPEHLDLEPLLNNLANVYQAKGDFARAETLLQRALGISEKATDKGQMDVAACANNLAKLYQFQGKYMQAETLFKRSLANLEQLLGNEHPEVAWGLDNLSALYQLQGRYTDAEQLSKRALAITEKALGEDDIAVADALTNLADLYRAEGRNKEAEGLYRRALTIAENTYGAENPLILTALANLLVFDFTRGDQKEVETLIKRALTIFEKALGSEHKMIAVAGNILLSIKGILDYRVTENEPLYKQTRRLADKLSGLLTNFGENLSIDSPEFAPTFYGLGSLYRQQGRYGEAEGLAKRALAITEKQLGPEHPEVATSLLNLVGIYRDQGKYAELEPLFQRALAIYEKAFGPAHPRVAESLEDLADLYQLQGRYADAERLYKRALTIVEKVYGFDHPFMANGFNSLASLYQSQGRYAEAESLFKQAMLIVEKVLGPDHSHISALNNLAVLYIAQSRYAEAEPLLKRALAFIEKSLGPDHPKTALASRNLATLYINQRRFAEAEPLFKGSLAIVEKVFGAEHPDVAIGLNNLATLYMAQGKNAETEPLLLRAMAIIEKTLGPAHPHYILVLNNLSVLFLVKGDISRAIDYLARSNEARERDFNLNLFAGSEREKLLYINQSATELHQMISLHTQSAPQNVEALRLGLTGLLRRKGRTLDLMANDYATLRKHMDPQSRLLLDKLTEAASRLSTLVLGGTGKRTTAEYRQEINLLEEQVNRLQGEISKLSAPFRNQSQMVTISGIQSVIEPGAALVEFGYYQPYVLKAALPPKPRYVAYILKNQGEPEWVDLGMAQSIDADVEQFRRALGDPSRKDVKELARALDEKLMQPVRKALGQTTRLFISPDGVLSLMPFEALVDEQGQYLVERYSFTYFTSGRDLLRLQSQAAANQAPVIIANPDFDDDGKARSLPASQPPEPAGRQRAADLDGAFFKPLPATAEEARAIAAIVSGAQVLTLSQATESAVKRLQSPVILHIATHGFFLTDQNLALENTRDLLHPALESDSLRAVKIENPFIRSGLALAGANRRLSGNENGILTALEASGLDLWGTKLVVLSACNTGVGEAKNSEGVYGLRRALTLAGAESQVMSLWSVSDAATRDLMVNYYRGLQSGEGRNEALRKVQLQMLHTPARSHPFYWASFIQSGEWGNLEGKRPK